MAVDQTKIIKPATLKADQDGFSALLGIAGYQPSNAELSAAKLKLLVEALDASQRTYAQKEAEFKTARDRLVVAQWAFHNAMLGAKDQVIALFGKDSDQVQALGLKKKSERKKPRKGS